MSQPPRQPQQQNRLLMPKKTASSGRQSQQAVPLHFGRSVNDLNRRAAYTVHAVGSASAGMKVLINLFNAAEKIFNVERDEERAYILYMRMLLVHNRISTMSDFTQAGPSKYAAELQQARSQVETLAERLNDRYKHDRTIDELRGFESLTRQFAIADREQPMGLGGGSGVSSEAATVQGGPHRRLVGIEANAAHRLLTLVSSKGQGAGSSEKSNSATIVFDLRPTAEKAVCRLRCERLVCLDGRELTAGCTVDEVEQLVRPDQLATWRAATAYPPPLDLVLLLILAWHRGASERLARDPTSCAAVLCAVIADAAAAASSSSSGQQRQPNQPELTPLQPIRFLVSGLQGLAAVFPAVVTDPSYAGPAEEASVSGIIDESFDDSSEPLVAVLSLEGGGGGGGGGGGFGVGGAGKNFVSAGNSSKSRVDATLPEGSKPPPKSLSHLLASQRDSLIRFDQETLDHLLPNRRSTGHGLTGLRNLGNSCYANCVLQCLSNTVALAMHFLVLPTSSLPVMELSSSQDSLDDADRKKPRNAGIAANFSKLCRALWCGAFSSVSPAGILTAVGRYASGSTFEGGQEQQDAQEFLLYLLDGMHEDLNRRQTVGTVASITTSTSSLDTNADELLNRSQPDRAANAAWQVHRQNNNSIIVDLFQGQLKSTLTCEHCRYSSITYDAFMYCSVPVVDNYDCSLNDCMEAFLQPERLSGACQWLCPACNIHRDAVKQLNIWRLPPCLLVHLKRFRGYDGGRKISSMVECPVSDFDLNRFCQQQANNTDRCIYNLYAVCNHYGRSDCGHYTAACFNSPTDQWHRFDDDTVTRIEPQDVVTSAAYILFYRRQA